MLRSVLSRIAGKPDTLLAAVLLLALMVVRLYCPSYESCCNKKRLGVAEANVTYQRMQGHLYGSSSPRRACRQHVQMQQHVANASWL